MNYLSTRGGVREISFQDAVMMGLADDGGLLLPSSIPSLNAGDLESFEKLAYPELAFQIFSRFTGQFPAADLKDLIDRSYANFSHPEVTPVSHQDGVYLLELFHGPTLAFKDVALQFLGNLFEHLLRKKGREMNIIGATSGDTGSAAIYGVQGKEKIRIFILHPYGKISPIQKLQMTTVTEPNVFNIAIRGNFDDGQRIVKEIFGDLDFKARYSLGAVNSINWARVMAQIVYYFYAWGRVRRETGCDSIYFSVPTGNFGDIFAGYMAKRMGLPVRRLIIGTNENNILSRFVNDGEYAIGSVVPTLSPSMDIQVASNFERYLYYLYQEDPNSVGRALEEFGRTGKIRFDEEERKTIRQDFLAQSVDRQMTLETIRDFYSSTGTILDPHTAVGVRAGKDLSGGEVPVVCLATAHPAKFGDAVREAIGKDPDRPASLEGIENRERRCEVLDASVSAIREFIARKAS